VNKKKNNFKWKIEEEKSNLMVSSNVQLHTSVKSYRRPKFKFQAVGIGGSNSNRGGRRETTKYKPTYLPRGKALHSSPPHSWSPLLLQENYEWQASKDKNFITEGKCSNTKYK